MAKLMGKWISALSWIINLRSTLIKSYQFTCTYRHDPGFKQTKSKKCRRFARTRWEKNPTMNLRWERYNKRLLTHNPKRYRQKILTEIERERSLFCHYSLSKQRSAFLIQFGLFPQSSTLNFIKFLWNVINAPKIMEASTMRISR